MTRQSYQRPELSAGAVRSSAAVVVSPLRGRYVSEELSMLVRCHWYPSAPGVRLPIAEAVAPLPAALTPRTRYVAVAPFATEAPLSESETMPSCVPAVAVAVPGVISGAG